MEVWTISTARRHSTGAAHAVHSIKVQSLRAHLKYINQCAKSLLSSPDKRWALGFLEPIIPTHMVRPGRHAGKGSASPRHCCAARALCCNHIVLGADTQNRHWRGQPLLPALHSWGRTSLPLSTLISACVSLFVRVHKGIHA